MNKFKTYSITHIRGSFINVPDCGSNFSKNQVIQFKVCNNLYIYISDLCLKFHLFISYIFILCKLILKCINRITEPFEVTHRAFYGIQR